ncbi:MAG: PilN domain-containing protein [Clostridiales bacterium]|nr:PilN domain-containing protein [Clostridiales bacterium]
MKDINFFSSYIYKKDIVLKKHRIFYCFIGIFIIGIICYGSLNIIKIKKLSNEVEELKKHYNLLNKDDKVNGIINMEENIKLLTENKELLNMLERYIDNQDFINELLLEDIKLCIPENIFLDSILINIDSIRIEGKAKDKESISQFQYELSQNECFKRVFIPEIIIGDEYFTFYIDIRIEEGKAFGTDD